jgi:hypothetical protein
MRKHEIPNQASQLCANCMHAGFAHNGMNQPRRANGAINHNACDLCMCSVFVGTVIRGDMAPELKKTVEGMVDIKKIGP